MAETTDRLERAWRLMPAGVFLFALVLDLVRLGTQPPWYDEKVTIDTASRSFGGIWHAARETEAPHLLYYSLMKPWLEVAGTSEWAARFPSVLFGALAAGVTAALGARLFGRVAGLVAGGTLAASSFVVAWSQTARGYTIALFLVTLAAYAFARALESETGGWWALSAGAIAAAGWVNLFAAAVLPAFVVAALLVRPRPGLRRPALALGAVLAVLLPQVVLVATGNNGQLDWISSPTPSHVARQVWDWASRNPIAVAACLLGLVQLARGAVRAAPWKTALVYAWLFVPPLVLLLLSGIQPLFLDRYLLPAAPAFCLAIGAGVASLPRRAALGLAVVLALSLGVRLGQHYVSPGEKLLAPASSPALARAMDPAHPAVKSRARSGEGR